MGQIFLQKEKFFVERVFKEHEKEFQIIRKIVRKNEKKNFQMGNGIWIHNKSLHFLSRPNHKISHIIRDGISFRDGCRYISIHKIRHSKNQEGKT